MNTNAKLLNSIIIYYNLNKKQFDFKHTILKMFFINFHIFF